MKKFSELQELTKSYLNGDLDKLKVEYEDDNQMRVEVAYTDKDHYHLFYVVDINQANQHVDFIEHYCNFGRDYINLVPCDRFEKALKEYLFKEKTDLI